MARTWPSPLPQPDEPNFESTVRDYIITLRNSAEDLDNEVVAARGGEATLSARLNSITSGSGNLWESIGEGVSRTGANEITISGADYSASIISGTPVFLTFSDASTLATYSSSGSNFTGGNTVVTLDDDPSAILSISAAQFSRALSIQIPKGAGGPNLLAISALSIADGNFIVGNGSQFTVESGATARTSIGLGTADAVEFLNLTVEDIIIDSSSTTAELQLANTTTGNTSGDGLFLRQSGLDSFLINKEAGDVIIHTSDTERFRIDQDGQTSIGKATPISWGSGWVSLQVGNMASFAGQTSTAADLSSAFAHNAYFDGTTWRYINASSDEATLVERINGRHLWYSSGPGTATNPITWTNIMTATTTGLAIGGGVIPSKKLIINDQSNADIGLEQTSASSNQVFGRFSGRAKTVGGPMTDIAQVAIGVNDASAAGATSRAGGTIRFFTSPDFDDAANPLEERLTITAPGALGFGTDNPSVDFHIQRSTPSILVESTTNQNDMDLSFKSPNSSGTDNGITSQICAFHTNTNAGGLDFSVMDDSAVLQDLLRLSGVNQDVYTGSGWIAWIPTVGTIGGGTAPTFLSSQSYYKKIGKTVLFSLSMVGNGGTAGSGGNDITITLPTNIDSNSQVAGTGLTYNPTYNTGVTAGNAAVNAILLRRHDAAANVQASAFPAGSRNIYLNGWYQEA